MKGYFIVLRYTASGDIRPVMKYGKEHEPAQLRIWPTREAADDFARSHLLVRANIMVYAVYETP